MSNKRRVNVKWDSSTEEEDVPDANFGRRGSSYKQNSPVSTNVETRRRGRGPSKRPCLNRNALMARENRQRKKAYLEKIENKLSFYQEENKNLVNMMQKQGIDIKRLTGEVAYLRGVLNNNTNITALLRTINESLKKLSSSKKDSLHDVRIKTEEVNVRHKCTCCMNLKQDLPEVNALNGFAMSSSDQLSSFVPNGTESSYMSNKKQLNNSNIKSEVETKGLENFAADITSPNKEFGNLMEVVQPSSISNSDEKKDDIANTVFDQLPSFNIDIFEDLPKCDEMINSVDNLHDTSSLFNEEELFQSLDNSGICLHVNSDKVSLEFCSICHLNSKNAMVD